MGAVKKKRVLIRADVRAQQIKKAAKVVTKALYSQKFHKSNNLFFAGTIIMRGSAAKLRSQLSPNFDKKLP